MNTPDENDVDKLAAMFNNLHITTPNGSDVDKLNEAFNSLHITTPSEKKLDAMLTDFENRTATDPHHPGQNLRKLLDDSPYLKDRFLDSAGHGHLERFDVLPADAHAGGTYDSGSKSIRLPQDRLDAAGVSKQNAADMVFVMGHEIQHSFNSSVTADATKKIPRRRQQDRQEYGSARLHRRYRHADPDQSSRRGLGQHRRIQRTGLMGSREQSEGNPGGFLQSPPGAHG